MPLMNGGGFVELLHAYRLLWVRGRYGAGKTAVAFKLAEYFLRREGYRLITNVPSIWSDGRPALEDSGMLHAVVIMDEAGLGLKVKSQLEAMAAYARKMDCIYIFPSFFPPVRAAQVVTVQPAFQFTPIGLPLVVYEYRVSLGSFKDRGWFWWWFPAETWGIYSTNSPEGGIDELVNYMAQKVQEFRQVRGVGPTDGDGLPNMAQIERGEGSPVADYVDALAEVAEQFEALSTRKIRRK